MPTGSARVDSSFFRLGSFRKAVGRVPITRPRIERPGCGDASGPFFRARDLFVISGEARPRNRCDPQRTRPSSTLSRREASVRLSEARSCLCGPACVLGDQIVRDLGQPRLSPCPRFDLDQPCKYLTIRECLQNPCNLDCVRSRSASRCSTRHCTAAEKVKRDKSAR